MLKGRRCMLKGRRTGLCGASPTFLPAEMISLERSDVLCQQIRSKQCHAAVAENHAMFMS